jgi:cbb3-type cytochrome oxidase subunit 1
VRWNLSLVAGFVSVLLGYSKGRGDELPAVISSTLVISLLIITIRFLWLSSKKEEKIYVSSGISSRPHLTDLNLIFSNFRSSCHAGVSNAALHGLFTG